MINKIKKFDRDNIFFTSDTHFFHDNIIKFCNRPFANVIDMNETLIQKWNNKVSKNDIVFHMGDFIFGNKENWEIIIPRLNGKIYFILGNHDYQNIRGIKYCNFEFLGDMLQIKIKDIKQEIFLSHYPLLTWPGLDRNSWNIHGHVHLTPTTQDKLKLHPQQYDVGVDNNNYLPVSFKELEIIMYDRINNNKDIYQNV